MNDIKQNLTTKTMSIKRSYFSLLKSQRKIKVARICEALSLQAIKEETKSLAQ